MTTPFLCLLIVMLIPFLLAGVGGFFRAKLGTFDNRNPRAQAAQLTGTGARAYAAQQNAWEALALFTPAVLAAHVLSADPKMAANLAIAFVVLRVAHAAFYLANLATLRSLSFMGAMVCTVWLFVLGT